MKNLIQLSFIILAFSSFMVAGTIQGNVKFIGGAPKPKPLKLSAECGSLSKKAHMSESLVVNDGNLANVLVWVEYKGKVTPPKTTVVLDQVGCVYSPHVIGIQSGQELLIKNSDPVLHNIHSMPKTNKSFNFAMPAVVKEKKAKFDKSEAPFYIKCDVHPWMKSWVGVFDHPYYAVTDSKGNFTIENVPAGKYEVVAWQEKFGIKRVKKASATVGEGTTALNFSFERPKKK